MMAVLGQQPPSIQVLWKSVQEFECHAADKPANKPTNGHRWKHNLLGGGNNTDKWIVAGSPQQWRRIQVVWVRE